MTLFGIFITKEGGWKGRIPFSSSLLFPIAPKYIDGKREEINESNDFERESHTKKLQHYFVKKK